MYPLFLKPFYDEKPWGGSRLKKLFGKDTPFPTTGESWEFSALEQGQSIVTNGLFAGQSLSQVSKAATGLNVFPLLIKLIDASDVLSVQVHPDDAMARAVEGMPTGKTEAWYILACDRDAHLIMGADFADGAALRAALCKNDLERHLYREPVKPADSFFIPGGTLHAIGKGMLIYEVQQPFNCTYRVYDWNRGRELHVEKSVEAYKSDAPYGRQQARSLSAQETRLIECSYFVLDRVDAQNGFAACSEARFAAYTALEAGAVQFDGQLFPYQPGQSFLIPMQMGGYALQGGTLLRAMLP